MSRFIGHLDADCFYVSAERVRDPFLIGKPVGVLGNNGACVIAKSYEMKALGIRTGEPIWDAAKRCPEGIYIKRDFHWYEVLSRQILDSIRLHSSQVEYYSIDEMFFEAEPPRGMCLQTYAEMIRNYILDKVGVPVTVGISTSRTLAKLISDASKPFGAKALTDRESIRSFLHGLPVTEISGIAGRRAKRLLPYHIYSCLDLADANRSLIRKLLTITGEIIWKELNGTAITPILTSRPAHQMLARGGSVGGPTEDPIRLNAWLIRNLERLIEELEFHQVRTGKITLLLQYRDGPSGVADTTLESPTAYFSRLLEPVLKCFHECFRYETVTHLHIIASHLTTATIVQKSLFEQPDLQESKLAQLKRQVNLSLGRFTLRSGATLPLTEIYLDPSSNYDICDVRGKICF